ncbi:MAG: DHH family phosphoesterase, partial [Clostridia bacterium]|nr:DHH family phosphoesterase [Clostridia bacterium]
MKQKYQINNNVIASDVEAFVEQGFPLPFARVLSSRGVTVQNMDKFFAPTFYDAFEMLNMDKAVEIVTQVLQSQGSVLIYGDYDADGLSASALLSLFFTNMGIENSVIIPNREQGYGLHCDLVLRAFEQNWYDLLITVDCGISNKDEIASLKEEFGDGVDIIVTDHHEIPDELPDCVCVNPKLGYPFAYLSGSGVAYKLVEALVGRDNATKYADLAIIGTIADMMPMLDENRALTNLGLSNFNHRGLCKLAELSNCKEISTKEIALRISPKINAAGRVGNPYDALTLLLLDERVPKQVVEKLLEINDIRRTILEETIVEAESMLDSVAIQSDRLVFIAGDNWQHGILGIVANRLREKYNYPTLVMCRDGDNYVGSARGVDAVNLHSLFIKCQDLLVKFGGHKSSVGFSVSV